MGQHYSIRTEEVWPEAAAEQPRALVELEDDERIIDTDWRGARRVVLLIATPVTVEYECGYNGCSRTVDSEDARCWQHEDEE
jgi:hypothetical protein